MGEDNIIPSHVSVLFITPLSTSNKNLFLDVGLEKQLKKELGWRVSVLPIPAFYNISLCMYSSMEGF